MVAVVLLTCSTIALSRLPVYLRTRCASLQENLGSCEPGLTITAMRVVTKGKVSSGHLFCRNNQNKKLDDHTPNSKLHSPHTVKRRRLT